MQKNELSPERVQAMLREKGIEINLQEAAATLVFLRMLARIVVAQYLTNTGSK